MDTTPWPRPLPIQSVPLLAARAAARPCLLSEDGGATLAAQMDAAARASCLALSETFGISSELASSPAWTDGDACAAAVLSREPLDDGSAPTWPRVSMGLEIETQWSAHFPDIWARFGLAERGVKALSAQELDELTRACSEREAGLLPRLRKTVECGIPRGNDRYWEFAFQPAANPDILAEQIRLLSAASLLPREGPRSLQITLGGLRADTDAVALAWLLAAFCADSARIRRGIELTRQIIHTGWARKGSAGVHEKTAAELSHGAQRAVEIRPLLLPRTHSETFFLLRFASLAAAAVLARQQEAMKFSACAPAACAMEAWSVYRTRSERLLSLKNMPSWPALSWGAGQQPDYAAWEAFASGFDAWAAETRSLGRQFAGLALGVRER